MPPDWNLLEYDTAVTLMNQPSFRRAADTRGKDISAPKYIGSLEYHYWNTKEPENKP